MAAVADLLVDMDRQHPHLPAAHQRGDGVGTARQREHEQHARENAGHAQRQDHIPEGRPPRRAEAARRLLQRRVDPLDDADQRQHHERQGDLDVARDHAKDVVHQRQRLIDRVPAHQGPVDQAVVSQQHHHAIEPDDAVELHRGEHEDHQERVAAGMLRLRDQVGEGIAEKRRDRRTCDRDPDCSEDRVVIERLMEEPDVVVQHEIALGRDHAGHGLVERNREQRQDGKDEEHDEEQRHRDNQQPQSAPRRAVGAAPGCASGLLDGCRGGHIQSAAPRGVVSYSAASSTLGSPMPIAP